jgi:transposase
MNILAMDLAKSNTVFCFYNSNNGEYEFGKVKTTPQQIHDLIVERSPARVVFEICTIAGWVFDIASALKVEVEVANPNHDAWRWKNVKRKNDRDDALKLARLSVMKQLPTVHIPKREVRQKRALIQYRHKLVRRRTQIKNTIRAILNKEGLMIPKGKNGWTAAGLQFLHEQSLSIEKVDIENMWRGQLWMELKMLDSVSKAVKEVEKKLDHLAKSDEQIIRLKSIAGLGPRLAEAIVAFLDEPERFSGGKQVGSYAGLAPKQYQSGQMDRQGRISRHGNKLLRCLLVEVSWISLRYNPWARQTYQRLLRGSPSRKNIAITAVARKLLVRCWAMLRDKQNWHSEISSEAA